nr:VIT1/CCC1 transporter family protein [Lachnospiraceae bacterium]
MRIPKINSNSYGGIWIGASLLVGACVPVILWVVFHKVFWIFIVLGALGLIAFGIVFAIEMHQDSAKVPYY